MSFHDSIKSLKGVASSVSKPVEVDKYHLLALGILAVISGDFYSWNVGLEAGVGTYAIIVGLMGWAYWCFSFCASELSSALPFAGGSYGLARCTVGYYLGYLTGCCEIMYYILLSAFVNEGIAQSIIDTHSSYSAYHPLILVLIYVSEILFISVDARLFWRLVLLLTAYSTAVLIIYYLGSLKSVDFHKWAYSTDDTNYKLFDGGAKAALRVVPYSLYFFIGAEVLNLTCNDVRSSRTEIPFGQIGAVATMFVHSILVLFISCSLAPGSLKIQSQVAPLTDGQC
jgi:ethanolamine permease